MSDDTLPEEPQAPKPIPSRGSDAKFSEFMGMFNPETAKPSEVNEMGLMLDNIAADTSLSCLTRDLARRARTGGGIYSMAWGLPLTDLYFLKDLCQTFEDRVWITASLDPSGGSGLEEFRLRVSNMALVINIFRMAEGLSISVGKLGEPQWAINYESRMLSFLLGTVAVARMTGNEIIKTNSSALTLDDSVYAKKAEEFISLGENLKVSAHNKTRYEAAVRFLQDELDSINEVREKTLELAKGGEYDLAQTYQEKAPPALDSVNAQLEKLRKKKSQ